MRRDRSCPPLLKCWIVVEQLGVEHLEHAGAGAGGGDNIFAVLEQVKKALGVGFGLATEAGVEGGLATAGLPLGEVHLHTQPSQHRDHALPHLWEELINQACDEEGRLQSA